VQVNASFVYWTNEIYTVGGVQRVPLAGGSVSTIVKDQTRPFGLAISSESLYWTSQGLGLFSAPLAGGTAATIENNQTGAWGIAIDSTSLYWTAGSTVMKLTPK
jgi:hypothetical protein